MTKKRVLLVGLLATACTTPLLAAAEHAKLGARAKSIITLECLKFKDLNADGRLDAYEDWRVPVQKRAADPVCRMNLAEKAGMMLIATNNPDCDGGISERGRDLIDQQQITRFRQRAKDTPVAADCSVKLSGFAIRGGYPNQGPSK
jgi:beta-glucosidase